MGRQRYLKRILFYFYMALDKISYVGRRRLFSKARTCIKESIDSGFLDDTKDIAVLGVSFDEKGALKSVSPFEMSLDKYDKNKFSARGKDYAGEFIANGTFFGGRTSFSVSYSDGLPKFIYDGKMVKINDSYYIYGTYHLFDETISESSDALGTWVMKLVN